MSPKIYNYKTTHYLSGSAFFPAAGLLIFGLGCFLNFDSVSVGLAALSGLILILTTHQGLEVNVSAKTFKQYFWILGYQRAHLQTYDLIEYAFIQSGKVRQRMESVPGFNSITFPVYNGYIKFSEEAKIHIIQAKDKAVVMNRLQVLATDLNLEIIDFTDADCVSVLPALPKKIKQPDLIRLN